MINYNKTNPYRIYLELIRFTMVDETLERTLTPLGNAISACERKIEDSESSNNQEYIDAIVDFEVEVVENLLGVAFVACQTYITNIVSRIISLHEYNNKYNPKLKLKSTGSTKLEILSFAERPNKKSKYTKVQLIDAFANYFKHRDEWSSSWEKLKGKSAITVELIMSVGASSGFTGNLRCASEILGNPDYKNTNVFYNIINSWHQKLYNEYYKELETLKLI